MKRLIAALAALLVAAPAADAKTLIVRYFHPTLVNTQDAENQFSDLTGLLDRRGASWKDIRLRATKTEWMRTGLHVWKNWNLASADAEQFDCVIVLGFMVGGESVTGTSPESLTITAKWPSVPVVFFGNTTAQAGKWTTSTTCSTGVKSLGTAYTSVRRTYSVSPVGSMLPWKALSINLHPVVPLAENSGTTFRSVVKMGYTSVTPGGIPNQSSILRADADSGFATAGSDTVVLWARYMNSAANGGPAAATNPKPIIFCDAGAGVAQDVGLMAMALQMADSASGGNVFDKDGAKPIKMGLAITAAVGRGHYSKNLSSNADEHVTGGAFCQADSCDTTNVLAGLDSLGTLTGLKTTFFVDACSLATYPSVKNWFYRAGNYRVGIGTRGGAFAAASSIAGAASSTYPADPFGRLRTRIAALPWGGSSPAADTLGACTAASDTMLTYCNLRWARDIIKSHFGEAFDPSAYPAYGDWSPVAYTKNGGGPGLDSTAFAIWKAGIRAIVIRPEFINTNPSVSAATSTAGALPAGNTAGTDPYGYFPEERSVNVYSDPSTPGRVIGRLNIVADRGQDQVINTTYGYSGHDVRGEWFEGLVQNRWYLAPIRYYYHSFWTRTQVISVSLGRLGGSATATSARNGWWIIKHTANQVTAANNLGWVDGNGKQRPMFTWAYVSELEP